MNNPVMEFTSWKIQATNGKAIFAHARTPQKTPMAHLNMTSLNPAFNSRPKIPEITIEVRAAIVVKFVNQQKSR